MQLQGDALSAASYAARSTAQQQSGNALDHALTKNDPYGQTGSGNNGATPYQNAYQSSGSKANSAYQTSSVQGYNSSSYANVQSSVANSYQPSSYASYQPNAVNSYQQQQQQSAAGAQNATGSVAGSGAATQNIPISGSGGQNNTRYVWRNIFYPFPSLSFVFGSVVLLPCYDALTKSDNQQPVRSYICISNI